MENYKSNSYKSREKNKESADVPEKKIEKVITGTAKVKKKGGFSKFVDNFIAEDVENVRTYLIEDVIIPGAKRIFSDMITMSLDMLLYGERGKRGDRRSTADRVSYSRCYDRGSDRGRSHSSDRTRTRYSYDDITVDTRGEAEAVLDRMEEIIDQYSMVSVADLYEMCDITGEYTDHKYGWTDLGSAKIERTRDGGFRFKLPRALPLK